MDVERNMQLFQELVSCGSNIYTWCYDTDGQLLYSNCPHEALLNTAFSLFGCKDQMLRHGREDDNPTTLGTAFGLMWAAAFQKENGKLNRAYVIGPVFFSDVSMQSIEYGFEYYNNLEISLAWKHQLRNVLPQLPVVQNIVLTRYALMLHYCITGKKLNASDLFHSALDTVSAHPEAGQRDRHKVWMAEQAMLQMVRTGDLNYKAMLNNSILISSGVPVHGTDPLRQSKTSLTVFASIVCRAAIEGGLSPEEAYSLGDSYIQSVENATELSELDSIAPIMYDDFVRRVHKCRTNPKLSKKVQKCCDYIEMHLEEKIRAQDLARLVGYTEYYITRKFKEETGNSISDYIKFAKIERSKVLLTSTELNVQEIADRLGFSSRSYFSRVFNEIVGRTPVQYRAAKLPK
jgi:AraC-like DNA-binding protein